MTKLAKNHPFIIAVLKLEELERKKGGVSDEIINARLGLKNEFPEFFEEYILAKNNKQRERIQEEKKEKEEQMKTRGCETVSYWKKIKEC